MRCDALKSGGISNLDKVGNMGITECYLEVGNNRGNS